LDENKKVLKERKEKFGEKKIMSRLRVKERWFKYFLTLTRAIMPSHLADIISRVMPTRKSTEGTKVVQPLPTFGISE